MEYFQQQKSIATLKMSLKHKNLHLSIHFIYFHCQGARYIVKSYNSFITYHAVIKTTNILLIHWRSLLIYYSIITESGLQTKLTLNTTQY